MNAKDSEKAWADACDTAKKAIGLADPRVRGAVIIDQARVLLSFALELHGIACSECHGYGGKTYPSTALWRRGGIAGQAFTWGVCDACWGTGRTDKKGINIRALEEKIHDLENGLCEEVAPSSVKRS